MFKKLEKETNSRITTKILATLLVLTLTFSNLIILGNAFVAYALDNNSTNVDNVRFNVYLGSEGEKEVAADINSEDLKLGLVVQVENGGLLKNGRITLEETNFKLKANEQLSSFTFNNIQSGQELRNELNIVSIKDQEFNLGLLNMESKIKLTGTYVNNKGEEIPVEATRNIKVDWNSQGITEENNPIRLSQKLITNRIYNIDGTDKRVIQLEITSGIENNLYPIKNTKIELNKPTIPNNEDPEEVKVVSYGTFASNGDDGFNFNTWNYNNEDKKLTIDVQNNETNNIVKWQKNAEDKFIVTYVYNKDVDITAIESEIHSEINLYGSNQTKLTKMVKDTLVGEEKGDAITQKIETAKVLYTSNSKLNEKTVFDVTNTIQIGYAKVGNVITLESGNDEITIQDEDNIPANTYYEYSLINKNEFLKLLGEDGTITISYIDGENQKHSITVINKDSLADYKGTILVKYEDKYEKIVFETSKPIAEGQLKIINRKQIEPIAEEQLEKVNSIITSNNLKVDNVINNTKSAEVRIEAPTTQVAIGLDKGSLSTTQTGDINITATLKTSNLKYDLYKDPVLNITLPEEITKIELNEEPRVLNGNGLELDKCEVKNNTIEISLKGEQTSYTGEDVQVLISTKLQTKKLLPTYIKDIVLQCTNNKETVYLNEDNNYAESTKQIKLVAEKGILIANSISEYNGQEPEVMAFKKEEKSVLVGTIEDQIAIARGIIINNEGKDLNNVEIIGKLNGKLNAEISLEGATVFYTQDNEVTKESTWTDAFSEDATGYKIVLNELKDKAIVGFSYEIKASTIISGALNFKVCFEDKEVESPNIALQTEQLPGEPDNPQNPDEPKPENNEYLKLEVTPNPATTETLKPGQEITLNIKVTNLKEEYLETEIEEGTFSDDENTANNQASADSFDGRVGYLVFFDANLSEGFVAKTAKITIDNGDANTIDLGLNKEVDLRETLDPKGIMNIELKLLVNEEIEASHVLANLSAKVGLPSETEEREYVGEVKNNVRYEVDKTPAPGVIRLPETINVKVDETIDIPAEMNSEDANKFTFTTDDDDIAKIIDNTKIEGISSGETALKVLNEDEDVIAESKIVVTNPNASDYPSEDIPEDSDDNPDEPGDEPGEEPTSNLYSISGVAWLDENENGKQELDEKLVSGVVVKIKDKTTGEYLKYDNGEERVTLTNYNGEYTFKELEPGNYIIEFNYDNRKYKLTTKTGADSKAYLVTADDKTIITTETIEVKNANISKINIGLIKNQDFDLEIKKYITKMTVQNKEGTKEYEFNKSNLAKVEIGGQYLSGSNVIIEYVIEVKNNGEIPAYAKKIVDYVSPEFSFNSNMNKDWYQGTDNNLYTEELANTEIKPGETKEVKLILTKTMTNSNAGLVNNSAEIYEDYNEYAIEDRNSIPANKAEKENDFSSADAIISIRTGGTTLYVGIVIASMLVLGGVIYLVNKSIIKKEEAFGKEVR